MSRSLITDLVYPMFTLECHYSVTPGDPGRTSGPPEYCYPPEAPELEIEAVYLKWPEQIPGARLNIWRLDMPDELGFIEHIVETLWEKLDEEPTGPEED